MNDYRGAERVVGLAIRGLIRAYQLLLALCRRGGRAAWTLARLALCLATALALPSLGRQRLRPGSLRAGQLSRAPRRFLANGTAQPPARDRHLGWYSGRVPAAVR